LAIKIVKVVLKGFKSHWNSTFTYSPGLTVVTGPTDSGKSAGVMQPIKWVNFGEPSGEAFIFTIRDPKTKEVVRQAEAIEVEVHREDGLVVSKSRRKGKTAYYINGKLISEKAEVPEEVKEALGLSKSEYGDFETSLNFAYQLEAPFILSETASVGAKVLGKLAGTEIVDKAIAAIMKRTYKARDEKNTSQKIIDQVNVELVEYLQVDDLKEKVEFCEGLLEQLDKDTALMDRVDKLAASYGVLSDKVDSCNILLNRLAVVHDIADDLAVIDLAQAKYDELLQLYDRLNSLEAGLSTIKERLKALKEVKNASTTLGQVESNYGRYERLNSLNEGYISQTKMIQVPAPNWVKPPDIIPQIAPAVKKSRTQRKPKTQQQRPALVQNLVDAVNKHLDKGTITDRRKMSRDLLDNAGLKHVPEHIEKQNSRGYCEYTSNIRTSGKIGVAKYSLQSTDMRDDLYKVKTAFHELYHATADGLEHDFTAGWSSWDFKDWVDIEETYAESASHYLLREAGITKKLQPAYPDKLVRNLPRLKKLDMFKNCQSIEDFGEVMVKYRMIDRKNSHWRNVKVDMEHLNQGWDLGTYARNNYADYILSNVEKLVDKALENSPESMAGRSMILSDTKTVWDKIKNNGPVPYMGNEVWVFNNILAAAIREMGVK
jgi:hypothetical protein